MSSFMDLYKSTASCVAPYWTSTGYQDNPWVQKFVESPTSNFCVIPSSILRSHSGMFPFSVTKSISKPAFLNSEYGTAVSEADCVSDYSTRLRLMWRSHLLDHDHNWPSKMQLWETSCGLYGWCNDAFLPGLAFCLVRRWIFFLLWRPNEADFYKRDFIFRGVSVISGWKTSVRVICMGVLRS